jgi:hypothetical protein
MMRVMASIVLVVALHGSALAQQQQGPAEGGSPRPVQPSKSCCLAVFFSQSI